MLEITFFQYFINVALVHSQNKSIPCRNCGLLFILFFSEDSFSAWFWKNSTQILCFQTYFMTLKWYKSNLKWKPTYGLPNTPQGENKRCTDRRGPLRFLEPGVGFAECHAIYFNSILELRAHSGECGDIISNCFVHITQFYTCSWYFPMPSISLTDFGMSRVITRRKSWSKQNERKKT